MKKLVLTALFMTSFFANGQNLTEKDKFYFKIGTEYRMTPLPTSSSYASIAKYTNPDMQNIGLALSYSFDYFLTNKWSIGISNSFRYDLITSESNTINGSYGVQAVNNGLMIGWHFYTDYHFPIKNKYNLFIRLGKSSLNGGANYTEKTPTSIPGISMYQIKKFNFGATNIALGYKKNKSELILGVYTSSSTPYFINKTQFTIPYFKFSRNLGKL